MNKKLISIILAGLMVFSSVSVMAARKQPTVGVYTRTYWPGETEHLVDADDCIATNNASLASDGVEISAGGSATWGFFIPYATPSVKIVYTGSGDITIKCNEKKHFNSNYTLYADISASNGNDSGFGYRRNRRNSNPLV